MSSNRWGRGSAAILDNPRSWEKTLIIIVHYRDYMVGNFEIGAF